MPDVSVPDAAQALLDALNFERRVLMEAPVGTPQRRQFKALYAASPWVRTQVEALRVALAAAPPTPEPVGVNVNEYVWVQLTEHGWRLFDHHHAQPIPGVTPPDSEKARSWVAYGDWQRFQLWDLMAIFGPYLHLGMRETAFQRNEVRFTDPRAAAGSPPPTPDDRWQESPMAAPYVEPVDDWRKEDRAW